MLFAVTAAPTVLAGQSNVTNGLMKSESARDRIRSQSRDCVIFSINVQDFAHPELSVATLKRLIALHEKHRVPVDFYLTTTMADLYEANAPELIEQIRKSAFVLVSYHVRPPSPYYTQYDWLGLRDLSAEQQRETVRRYETRGLDLATGQTTDQPGGYEKLRALFGYAPVCVSSQSDAGAGRVVSSVFKELGARMFAVHGRPPNFGDQRDGLPLRPELVDVKLFQHGGKRGGDVIEAALREAHANPEARAPYFIGVKMHDNDFIAETSAWVTTYMKRNRRPPWDLSVKAPLKSERDQAAMWELYESAVGHVTQAKERLVAVNAPMVLAMLDGKPEAAAGAKPTSAPAGPAWLYVSGTMHIETRRQSWPDPDQLLAFFKRATQAGRAGDRTNGMRWSIGTDIGWLEGEPRAREIIRATEALGVQWDVHAHQMPDRANCAAATKRFGGHPNTVASGLLLRELDDLRLPIRGRDGATWQAEVLWGIALQPLHGPGADDYSIGLWRPKSRDDYTTHDPSGNLIAVGNGHLGLADVEKLAREKPAAIRDAPVVSASVMFSPRTMTVTGSDDGIEAIEAWAARMAALPSVRWATIAETAEAWLAQGAIPSRTTVSGTSLFRPAPTGPRPPIRKAPPPR